MSALPAPVVRHVPDASSSSAAAAVQQSDSIHVPSGSTMPDDSPISRQPACGVTSCHLSAPGSEIAPHRENASLPAIYSPPWTITLPSGRTADAKYIGL